MENLLTPATLQLVLPVLVAVMVASIMVLILNELKSSSRLSQRAEMIAGDKSASREKSDGADLSLIKASIANLFEGLAEKLRPLNPVNQKFSKRLLMAGIRNKHARLYYLLFKGVGSIASVTTFYFLFSSAGTYINSPLMAWGMTIGITLFAFFLPDLYVKNLIEKRRTEVQRYWQDVLDLMIICVESGLSVEAALRRVTSEIALSAPVLASELAITIAEMSILPDRRSAYANLSERIDLPSVKSATIALIQAERQGSSIAQSLRTISHANREIRVTNVERKAAALGPKLTIPLVVFFLPVLFVVILGPIFLNAIKL